MRKFCTLAAALLLSATALADTAVPASVRVPALAPLTIPGTIELSLAGNSIDPNGWRVTRKTAGVACPPVDGPATRAAGSPLARMFADRIPRGAPVHPRHATAHHLLYATERSRDGQRSVLLDATGKVLLEVPRTTAAVVEDAAGHALGLLAIANPQRLTLLDPTTGAPRWTSAALGPLEDAASVALSGHTLLVALYHRIASGASLIAVDVRTGALVWVADVAQLQIPHSQYLNDVTVFSDDRDAILLGLEAGGCHLQVFDLKTGARRLAVLEPPRP